jgi:hypothetical protein
MAFTEEQKKYHRDWYHAHRDVELKRRRLRTQKHRRFVAHIISEIKLILGCESCGYGKDAHALDFHHRNREEKEFDIASYSSKRLLRVLAEIEKCGVMCANCHRIHTRNERVSVGV